MTFRIHPLALCVTLLAALALSGCQSSEERAEGYYQSGLVLLAEGDEERALVEFRNVFKYDGFHKEARKTYADILVKQGNTTEAYSQYLRLIEQYPDTVDVRQTLAELALMRGDWTEVERHGKAALALQPDVPGVKVIGLALEYRAAVLAKDEAARTRLADAAQAILEAEPGNPVALRVVLDRLASGDNPQQALPVLDAALEQNPDVLELQMMKFQILAKAEDIPGTGAQLKQMYALFPEDDQVKASLIGWYLVQNDIDGAEAFLRELAGSPTGDPAGHVAVVQLLQAARSPEAAQTELDRLIAANTGTVNADLYGALRATIDFETGKTAEGITAMEAILKNAEASDQTRRFKGMLARMLDVTGNRVGARALVEEVLAEDVTNVEALKLRGAWLISEDKPGDAIVDLRTALGQSPRDPAILTLMAAAHERDGNLDLAGERLALAVEVSGSAAENSLRYAQFLLRQDRVQVAETVLADARRVSPADPAILQALAQVYLQTSNWAGAQDVVNSLRPIMLPEVQESIPALESAILLGQNRVEESLAVLESQVAEGSAGAKAVGLIVQTQIRSGRTEEARQYLDEALAKTPDDKTLRLLSGGLDALLGDAAAAEAEYRSLIAEAPTDETPVRLLYGLLRSSERFAEATQVLDEGLAAVPNSGTLTWMKAGELETAGDIDGAIAVYEGLYAKDSGNVVVANNLASLITTHRSDPESLERAFAIARRLRGLEVPAFQDTYGWIEYRRGNLEEALVSLEPAAKGLPDDPLAQHHLGMVYADLGRRDDAIKQFERVIEIGGNSTLPQIEDARAKLKALASPSP